MNGEIISLICAWSVALFLISCCLILIGINQSKKSNIFGILLLSIPLPIIGTFIGCMIMYKKQYPEFRFWKSFWIKIKKIFNWKIKFKRKSNKEINKVT